MRKDSSLVGGSSAPKPRKSKSTTKNNLNGTSNHHPANNAILIGDDKMFQQLSETLPHIAFSTYADGAPEHYNHRWYDYTGSSTAIPITDWEQFVHPEDIERLIAQFNHAISQEEEYNAEYRLRNRDGYYRWHLAKSAPIRDGHNKIIRWFGTATDIHDKKELEENLQYLSEASKILSTSLDYHQTLGRIAHLAVPQIADWCTVELLDPDGNLEQVGLAHKDPEKIAWAKELRRLDPPDMNAPQGVPNVIKTGESEIYSYISDEILQNVARSKKHLKLLRSIGFTSAMIAPLCREDRCIGAITFVSTENKRRYSDADLAMANELASRASIALENAGLYQASQRAISLRDEFISVASHELKTPVTSAKIFTQVMQRHSALIGDKKSSEYLKKMDKQLDKLTELIYNMLDISKIQVGRMELREQVINFDQLVAETVATHQQNTSQHEIEIKGHTNQEVCIDEDRISQVLSNLLENAIKYSPHAKKVIVHLAIKDDAVVCGVEDFGIGIDEPHLQRIFERFYRVFDTTDKTFPGLGIGLYISAEIIKRHDGLLWVESNKGSGSTFYVSLPIYKEPEGK